MSLVSLMDAPLGGYVGSSVPMCIGDADALNPIRFMSSTPRFNPKSTNVDAGLRGLIRSTW